MSRVHAQQGPLPARKGSGSGPSDHCVDGWQETPNDFADLDAVEHRLLAFGERYEQLATPFEWKFTRADLRRLMVKLEHSPLVGAAA